MAFILVLLLSLTLLTRIELSSAEIHQQRILARENARLGMLVALGNLQRYAGPDQRVTARAEIQSSTFPGAAMWTGLWDASSGASADEVWLVSGDNPNPAAGATGDNTIPVFPGTTHQNAVRAEWVPITEGGSARQGQFGFWVEEQSVKARINRADQTADMPFLSGDHEGIQDLQERLLLSPAADYIFDELQSDDDQPIPGDARTALGRALTTDQIGLALPADSDPMPIVQDRRHDFSTVAAGVLENPLEGGLKVNLTGRDQDSIDFLLAQSGNEEDHYLKGDFLLHFNIDPETGLPFPENVNPNSATDDGGSLSTSGDLVRVPAADFYNLRDNAVDPDDGELQVVRNIMPIVTEASFRLGAFHTQSDTKHRIRFHADVEFWNPYPFPIRFPGEGQNRSFTAMIVPSETGGSSGGLGRGGGSSEPEQLILSIEKLGGGLGRSGGGGVAEELHTNLFNFDEELGSVLGGGSTNNSIEETVMTSWMVVDNTILQPGEVYHATTERTVGLARDLGGYVLRPGGDPENAADYEPDPEHDYHKWSWHTTQNPTYPVLEPNDQIRISLRMPENGISFRLIPFDSRSRNDTPVYEEKNGNEWAKPVFELRNIYKISDPDLLVDNLSGAEYSRSSSSSYTLDNYNIGFHFRLVDDFLVGADATAVNLGLGFDLRQPIWDYNNPAVRQAVMVGGIFPDDAEAGVEPSPFDAPDQLDLFFNGLDIFADGNSDSHGGSYQRAFLFPRPNGEPLSVGSFHSLPMTYETVEFDADDDGTDDIVQLRAGMPWGGSLNRAFDKYFFTGVPSIGWTTADPLPVTAELRADADPARMRNTDAAEDMLVKGSFNVNSLAPRAWAAMLSRTLLDWEWNGSSNTEDLKNAFLNLTHSTDGAIAAIGGPSEESDLTAIDPDDLSSSEDIGRLAMRHPLRRLTDDSIYNPLTDDNDLSNTDTADSLVEFIIDELETYFDTNPPFASVSEFVESGVLARAIRRSGINGAIPSFAPAYISQAVLLEPIAPFLTVRSDTFIVRSIGQKINPATGLATSEVVCEAVVQRLPDRVDGDATRRMENAVSNNNPFGRQFVIKAITWKGNDS